MKILRSGAGRASWVVLAVAVALTGCSTFESKKVDYRSATKLPPLEVPPDLTAPQSSDRYSVPEARGAGTATYSAYSKERSATPQQAAQPSGVLPKEKTMRVERAGSQRWLVVSGEPGALWPVVKEFWQELGFVIVKEFPEAGIMETDWAENRAKIPHSTIRSALGKVFDSAYSTGERDKFRTRLERGANGTTEVYISHRGMEEVLEGPKEQGPEGTIWQPRQPDPELEAEMLGRLMVRLGAEEARAQSLIATAPERPRARLVKDQGGSGALVMEDAFDRAWRRVGLALDRVGFTVEDRDRNQGVYFVRYQDMRTDGPKKDEGWLSKLAFWRSDDPKTKAEQYRIQVTEVDPGTRVSVLDKSGTPDKSEAAGRILALLLEQLK